MQGSGRVLELRRPAATFWFVAIAVLVADQLTKSIIRVRWSSALAADFVDRIVARFVSAAHDPNASLPFIDGIVRFTFVRNEGAAFGLLPGYQPIFIATSVVVLVVVAAYWRRSRPAAWPIVIALALIAGGAFGNLIDRALFGKVTDFIEFAFVDFPVFNVADSAIVIGVGMLVGWLLFVPEETLASEQNGDAE